MVTTAAIIGGSALASGALSSSSSKKASDGGSETLARIAEQLFGQTEPHRQLTLDRALSALMGTLDLRGDPTTQARRSSIQAEGARGRSALEQELARLGLRDSATGIARLSAFDNDISRLLSETEVAEQERLSRLGETIGFGVLEPSTNAAGILSRSESASRLAAQQSNAAGGQALGQALAQLFSAPRTSAGAGTTVNYVGTQPPGTGASGDYFFYPNQ